MVKKALPIRPKNLENKIAQKNPNSGNKIISIVILNWTEEEGFEPTKRNSR